MSVPTKTLPDIESIFRMPMSVVDDPSNDEPFYYVVDSNGRRLSAVMNLSAFLRQSDGKVDLANALQYDSVGQAQLATSIRPYSLGTPAAHGTNQIAAAQNLTTNKSSTYTLSEQPDVPRNVIVTIVDSTPSITSGVVTVAGLGMHGLAQTETFDISAGAGTYTGTKIFATITGVTNGAVATLGGAGDETIAVGFGKVIGVGMPIKCGYPIGVDTNYIIESTDFLNGHTYEGDDIAHQPDVPRNVTIAITDTGASIVAGTVTVNGTDDHDQEVSESFSLAGPTLSHTGAQLFKTITSVVTSGVTVLDGSSDETFIVGIGALTLADVRSVLLGGDLVTFLATGGAAGDLTVTGIKKGDRIVAVYSLATAASIATIADLTAEFTATADDVINNTDGTATTNNAVLVLYKHKMARVAAPVVAVGDYDEAGIDVSAVGYTGNKELVAYISPLA